MRNITLDGSEYAGNIWYVHMARAQEGQTSVYCRCVQDWGKFYLEYLCKIWGNLYMEEICQKNKLLYRAYVASKGKSCTCSVGVPI